MSWRLVTMKPPLVVQHEVAARQYVDPWCAVLSADAMPPSVQRAASEVARNGDHWENVLKAIHSQDQNMCFSDSNSQQPWNQFNYENSVKREEASSQSDEDAESKQERRKRKKKSRWGDEPPLADIKPPGLVAPLPPGMPPMPPMPPMPDEDGLKLTTVNRNNQALMQYAMTNFGTTNLSPEDWKKCEDNFKLNLLFQDMLKKRQEVERLAASGKHKYEYDSDEDTAEGTWEHK
ncbi:hypothetical protein MSG28_012346 [Choristoneura fumiferana]|uniref:Uncharacterized protein n=1 Tax=Choristoneura fumiferana TaxID=7141 RepID=A0ACC0KDW0_CHOFU|nr:hypothetical protein MSG28_012346 [Choristoneura fumiferana]